MNNIKSMKLNSKDIIITRKKIDDTITDSWRIIKNENVMSNKAIKAGIGSGLDLKALYNRITQLSNTRIKVKLMLNAINNGITKFDFNESKKTHYYTIYAACEAKEAIAHWKTILASSTINPKEKSKKGLKGTGKREIFSSAKINSLLKDLQLLANKYDAEIAKFNDSTTIEITDDADSIGEINSI